MLSQVDNLVWHPHPMSNCVGFRKDRICIFQNPYTNKVYRLYEVHELVNTDVQYRVAIIRDDYGDISKFLTVSLEQSHFDKSTTYEKLSTALEAVTKLVLTP